MSTRYICYGNSNILAEGCGTLLKNPPFTAGPNIPAAGKRLIFHQTDSLVPGTVPSALADGIPDGSLVFLQCSESQPRNTAD
jgi:hypothetical protein